MSVPASASSRRRGSFSVTSMGPVIPGTERAPTTLVSYPVRRPPANGVTVNRSFTGIGRETREWKSSR